jgi:hypothetical protein
VTNFSTSPAHCATALTAALLCCLLGSCGERAQGPQATSAAAAESRAAGTERTLKQTSFIRSWDLELGAPVLTSWISDQVPDLIFFQTKRDNSITAIDTMSGATRWVSIPLPRPIKLSPYVARVVLRNADGVTYNDDRLYVISDDVLFCFDLASGQVIWRYELPFSPSTGPMAVGSGGDIRVYVGDWQGRVRVVTLQPSGEMPYEAWQWNVQTDLSADFVEHESLVYVGDHKGVMHCFALDREEKWQFPAGGLINGAATPRDRVLYFGNTDNVIFAINRLTGEKYGQLNLNGPVNRAPFYFRDEPKRLYVWVDSKDPAVAGLYALGAIPDLINFSDNTSEKPHPPLEIVRMAQDWHFPGATRLVGSTPQHLFVTSRDSTEILAVRRDTGKVEWSWNCAEERSGSTDVNLTEYQDPSDLNRSLYTYDSSGKVIAYRFFGYVPNSADVVADQARKIAPPDKDKAAAAPAAPAAPAAGDAPPAAPAAPADAAPK